jgi:two-component system LytT family response regulator
MKAIIVEDNPSAANVLKLFLDEYPDRIDLCGTATTLAEARTLITAHRPDLWLLDIRLQDSLVFSLLSELKNYLDDHVSIIFLTGYYEPDYLHEALKVAALDYIVKPVDRDLLFAALDKASARSARSDIAGRLDRLEKGLRQLERREAESRLAVPRVNGEIDFVEKVDVISIVTEDNVTRFQLKGNKSIRTTKLLKVFEEMLEHDPTFLRVSKQAILNLNCLSSYNPRSNMAVMTDGTSIEVSRRKGMILEQILLGRN